MTKEEIWEKLAEEVKLRGFSPLSYYTYKSNITTFLDWCNKPYEDLDEEDFRNYLIHQFPALQVFHRSHGNP